MYKIIIAGSRTFNNYKKLKRILLQILNKYNEFEIVSGTARGADKLGEKFANEFNLPIKRFPANWNKDGKSAGFIRNSEMAKYADGCIVFWDGKSKGTEHMIKLAKVHNLKLMVFKY